MYSLQVQDFGVNGVLCQKLYPPPCCSSVICCKLFPEKTHRKQQTTNNKQGIDIKLPWGSGRGAYRSCRAASGCWQTGGWSSPGRPSGGTADRAGVRPCSSGPPPALDPESEDVTWKTRRRVNKTWGRVDRPRTGAQGPETQPERVCLGSVVFVPRCNNKYMKKKKRYIDIQYTHLYIAIEIYIFFRNV